MPQFWNNGCSSSKMGGPGVVLTLAVIADAGIWVYSKVQANSKSQAKKRA